MEVTVGPKSFRSRLPMGKVPVNVAEQIRLADIGALSRQIYNFNIRISRNKQVDSSTTEATYHRTFVLNGACRFKRYGIIDMLRYKIGRFFVSDVQ